VGTTFLCSTLFLFLLFCSVHFLRLCVLTILMLGCGCVLTWVRSGIFLPIYFTFGGGLRTRFVPLQVAVPEYLPAAHLLHHIDRTRYLLFPLFTFCCCLLLSLFGCAVGLCGPAFLPPRAESYHFLPICCV
jgi:hypothetical protein